MRLTILGLLLGVSLASAAPQGIEIRRGGTSIQGFEGLGGIAVSTNVNGGIVIDGSGISAGSLPAFSITNRYTATFTNLGPQLQQNHLVVSSNLTVSAFAGLASLRVTNTITVQGTINAEEDIKMTTGQLNFNDAFRFYYDGSFLRLSNVVGGDNFLSVEGSSGDVNMPGQLTVGGTVEAQGLRIPIGGSVDFDHLLTNALLGVGANGIIRTNTLGTGLSMSAGGVLSATGSGSGDVTKVGTPADNQLGVWTGDGTLEGEAQLTYVDNVLINTHGSGSGFRVILTGINRTNIYGAGDMIASGDYTIRIGTADGVAVLTSYTDTVLNHQTNLYVGGDYIHTRGTVIAAGYNTTNSTPGSTTAALTIRATNLTESVRIQGAHEMSVLVTNIIGLQHKAFASTLEIAANRIHNVIVTNRVTGVCSVIYTNLGEGQLITLDMFGEASGGSSRVITLIPHTGFLALDGNNPGTGPALSLAFTLTNGNKAEISGKVMKVFGATNYIEYLVNQSKF